MDPREEVTWRANWGGALFANKSGYVTLHAPLSGDQMSSLHLTSVNGVERLSDAYVFEIDMLNSKNAISPSQVVGKEMMIEIEIGGSKRLIHGFVGEFEEILKPVNAEQIANYYKTKIYPAFWFLKFTSDCRIFQDKSVVEIIQEVLSEHNILFSLLTTSCGQSKREFCVQYNESAFDFLSRLMEEEGIYYYFEHEVGRHTMVLSDQNSTSKPLSGNAEIPFLSTAPFVMGITQLSAKKNIVPEKSKWRSFDFEKPTQPIDSEMQGPPSAGGGRIYRYPSTYVQKGEVDQWTKMHLSGEESLENIIEGDSLVHTFMPGFNFDLTGNAKADLKKKYVLYEVEHSVKIAIGSPVAKVGQKPLNTTAQEPLYHNKFKAFDYATQFHPKRKTRKPVIPSTQTATVTGPQGEKVYTDKYGRIKVQFHWDLLGQKDEKSSCWIRVATPWAGSNWGMITTPRIDMEVVVTFLNGDPDKPLVVGCVYNGQNLPPYRPDEYQKSTIKSHTITKDQAQEGGYNEIRIDDTEKKEEIYIRAQKDMVMYIQNDMKQTNVGGSITIDLNAAEEDKEESPGRGNYTMTLKKGDWSLTLDEGNQSTTLHKGNQSVTLDDGNQTITLNKGSQSITLMDGNINVKLASGNVSYEVDGDISFKCTKNFNIDAAVDINMKAGAQYNLMVGAEMTEKVGAARTITIGGEDSLTVGGAINIEVGAEYELAAGAAISMEAGAAMDLEAGAAFSVTSATIEMTAATVNIL